MIKGKQIYLRAIEKPDLNKLKEWRNIPYFRKHFREYRELNDDMQENWYKNKVLNDPSTIMFSIVRNLDEELVGCVGLCYVNWISRHADLSLYIGAEDLYIDDLGYAKEACNLILNYGFDELNLNKVWTEIYEFDMKKRNLYSEMGFIEDGRLRQNYYNEGRYWDSLILSILKEDR